MRPTKQKRALSLLLAFAAALSMTVLPGHASRFQDVEDEQVSLAADTLSSLGVVGGTGEGEFSPDGHLTRAQLCKMAVEIMGMGEQAQAQAYRTIFTDMGKNHWARGYVNLAATTQVPAESGIRLMLGLGDGAFGPDREVTYQEAVTLALRILGYGAEANRAWPYSAIETATHLGLDQDLGVEQPYNPITRAQTALLFYHLLSTPAKGSTKPYADNLGKLVEDAILLAGDATVNGSSGWAVVATGESTQSYLAAGPVDQSLLGKRGWALLDKEDRFVTLIPDDSSCVTAPVERKQAYYLYLTGRGRYTLAENTPVYTGSTYNSRVTTYKEYMANLSIGDVVTLYLNEQGRVVGLYRAEASTETRFLVVGNRGAGYEALRALTGNEQNYTIRKNGAVTSMSAIKPYDVVTYDPVSKVLDACDVRLSCVYENATPYPSGPSKITAAGGNQFDVLADAVGDFYGRKLGEPITLLFTSNGKVAGLLPKGSSVNSFALGVLTADGLQLVGCDLTLKAPSVLPEGVTHADLLNVFSTQGGNLTVELAGTSTTEKFDTLRMSLGGLHVSSGVQIYERTNDGLLPRSLSELPSSVDAVQYHQNTSSQVDLIILRNYSGDGIKYGRIDVLTGYVLEPVGGTNNKWRLGTVEQLVFTRKDGTKSYTILGGYHSGGYGAVMEYNGSFAGITHLQEITKVPSDAFFTQDDVTYVRTSKGVYRVADDVQCFNGSASKGQSSPPPLWVQQILANGGIMEGPLPPGMDVSTWFPDADAISVSMFDSLGECRNFSDTVTIYIDTAGQQVRVVEAGS